MGEPVVEQHDARASLLDVPGSELQPVGTRGRSCWVWLPVLQSVVIAVLGYACLAGSRHSLTAMRAGISTEILELLEESRQIRAENEKLRKEALLVDGATHLGVDRGVYERELKTVGLYQAITGLYGHDLPEMYGKVKEKTIWMYWHDPENCPSSTKCVLPAHVELCLETIRRNRGSFDVRVLHIDLVHRYVNMFELPLRWRELDPQHQKDAIMNAMLGRYGGVALDITSLLLRPLGDYWDEMEANGYTFRGYVYRINGQPYRHAEVTAVWFLMSRRDGIFNAAVRNQVQGLGGRNNGQGFYHQWYFAFGDQTLTPILEQVNYSLPKCYEDNTLIFAKEKCPEFEQPRWYTGLSGPARNDIKILLRDPRDGPHLPFAMSGMALWNINGDGPLPPGDPRFPDPSKPGGPMYGEKCASMKECWNVFLRRFNDTSKRPEEAPLLSFVKLFGAGANLKGKSRKKILSMKDSFFYNWLKMAGLQVD